MPEQVGKQCGGVAFKIFPARSDNQSCHVCTAWAEHDLPVARLVELAGAPLPPWKQANGPLVAFFPSEEVKAGLFLVWNDFAYCLLEVLKGLH